jgi:arginyl-tRNA synthetase
MRESADAAVQAANLLDELDRTLTSVDGDAFPIAPILRPGESSDVTVIVRDDEDAPAVARRLESDPGIASIERSGQRFVLRHADERIAEVGAGLESGADAGMATDDLLTDEPYIVDFCGPNATKALHVGHLRNVALGHALASALEAAGARVARQSHVGDAGRSMGEAMAGWLRYADGGTPEQTGEKSDHFVGRLYARYVQDTAVPVHDVKPEDVAVARDIDVHDDLAHELIERWERGDAEAIALWRRIRGWATAGQDETLARLGVRFERVLYDSSYVARIEPFVRMALERGVLTRAPHGALGYETGQEEYPWLPLSRADGFPTQNLRGLVMWHELMHEARDMHLIHVSGWEWRSHTVHVEEMLGRLAPGTPVYPTTHVRYGMVEIEGGTLSSSSGEALLIDELYDGLLAQEQLRELAREDRPGCGVGDLAAMTLLGSCLNRPVVKSLAFDPGRLLDDEVNVGWKLARAWARAWDPANDGAADPAPEDPSYRFFVMQSQLHRRLLARAIEQLDVLLLVRFLAHLSEWYLDADLPPRVGRVVRTTLGNGLAALGLIRPPGVGATP